MKQKQKLAKIKRALQPNNKILEYSLGNNYWIESLQCYKEWIQSYIGKPNRNVHFVKSSYLDFVKTDPILQFIEQCNSFFSPRMHFDDPEEEDYFFYSFGFDVYKLCAKLGVVIPQERDNGKYGSYTEWE